MEWSQSQKPKAKLNDPSKKFQVYRCCSLGSDHSDLFDFCKFPNQFTLSIKWLQSLPALVPLKTSSRITTLDAQALCEPSLMVIFDFRSFSLAFHPNLLMGLFFNVFHELGIDFDLPFVSSLADVDEFYSLCDPGERLLLLILFCFLFDWLENSGRMVALLRRGFFFFCFYRNRVFFYLLFFCHVPFWDERLMGITRN